MFYKENQLAVTSSALHCSFQHRAWLWGLLALRDGIMTTGGGLILVLREPSLLARCSFISFSNQKRSKTIQRFCSPLHKRRFLSANDRFRESHRKVVAVVFDLKFHLTETQSDHRSRAPTYGNPFQDFCPILIQRSCQKIKITLFKSTSFPQFVSKYAANTKSMPFWEYLSYF